MEPAWQKSCFCVSFSQMLDLRHPTFSLWRSGGPTAPLHVFIQQDWALCGSFPKSREKGPLSCSHTPCLRGHCSRDLVFLCCDKQCVPVLWAAQDALGRMLKASEGSQRKALGGSEGPGCHPLPQPHQPLALGLGCHMEPPYRTPLQRILFQHHPYNLHTLILLPVPARPPGLLKPLLQLLTFGKLAVRTTLRSGPTKAHGSELQPPYPLSALPPGRKMFPLQITVPREPQRQDMN